MTRTRPVHGSHVHGRVYGPCTRLLTACTDPIHGRTLPEHGHVHGRVPCTLSSLRPVYRGRPCRPTGYMTRAVDRPYTTMHGPCTWSVHDPNTAVYTARIWPCTMYTPVLRPVYTAVHRPCTWSVHDSNTAVYGCAPCTQACLRPVYTAVYGP